MTISIGVAALTPSFETRANMLVQAADAALYASKRRRNCVTAYGQMVLAEAS